MRNAIIAGRAPCERGPVIRPIFRLYQSAFAGLQRDVWLLALVLLINRAGTMVLPFLTLFLTQQRDFSVFHAGRLLSLYGVGAAVGSYAGGWLSDRIGALRTMQLSLVTAGIGFVAFTRLQSTVAIASGLFLLSVLAESFRPAVMTATAERAGRQQQARAFALLRLAANLGISFGPALAGFLALRSYTWIFVADALTCWAAALVLSLTLTRRVPESNVTDEKSHRTGSPWTDGPFLLLMLLVAALASVIFQVFGTYPLYLKRGHGFDESTIGLLLALNGVLIVLFEMVIIHWADRRSHLMMTGLGAALTCFGFALMPLGQSVWFIAMTVVVWTTGEMLALPLANALAAARASDSHRGRYLGVYNLAYSLAFIVAPWLGTFVYETYGSRALWFGIGGLGIILWLGALGLRPILGDDGSSPSEQGA